MDRIIKFLITAVFLLLLFFFFNHVVATEFTFQDQIPIHFVVPDSLTGLPTAPDSINLVMYQGVTTDTIRNATNMTLWNSEVGHYYYLLEAPDTAGIYTIMIKFWDYGLSTPWVVKRLIYVRDSLMVDRSHIFETNLDGYTTAGTAGSYIRLGGDTAQFMNESDIVSAIDSSTTRYNLDSLRISLGFLLGAGTITKFNNDADTLWVTYVSDTLFAVVYYHVGKTPGYRPDSTKAIPKP